MNNRQAMRRAVWISSVLLAATLHAQSVPPRHSLDHEALAKKIIERLDMKEGETFLAVAHPGLFDEMIPYLLSWPKISVVAEAVTGTVLSSCDSTVSHRPEIDAEAASAARERALGPAP